MSGEELAKEASKLAEELRNRANYLETLALDPVPEISSSDLDKIMNSKKIVFLLFTADWCGPCLNLLEALRGVAAELSRPDVFFGRVDVDKSYSLAERFNVDKIPSILVFVNGKIVDVILGSMSKTALKEKIMKYLSSIRD